MAPLVLYFTSSSEINQFPVVKTIRIAKENKSIASFKVKADLDGMNKIILHLPQGIKRRSFDVMLNDDKGHEVSKLHIDTKKESSSQRDYYFDKSIQNSREKNYTVLLIFNDGPVLQDGMNRRKLFKGLAITICYDLDIDQVKQNFLSFKSIKSPILITTVIYILYAICVAFILTMVSKSR
ncbi:MAG: hypothetical protein ACYTG7_16145 [Planctomycetota bacterium]|jgi:hypothetical protein